MTSRFVSAYPNTLQAVFATLSDNRGTELNFNVDQGQQVPVVRCDMITGTRDIHLMQWGLIPSWSKDKGRQPTIAPAERLERPGMFKLALALRRCIVPMEAFYEWDQTTRAEQPYAFGRQDGAPLAVAGLWDMWRHPMGYLVSSFSIITTTANTIMAAVHDRMPVVLEPEDWSSWLDQGFVGLLRPAGDDVLRRWRVSNRVNLRSNNHIGNLEEACFQLCREADHGRVVR